jgi:hypothetical protein
MQLAYTVTIVTEMNGFSYWELLCVVLAHLSYGLVRLLLRWDIRKRKEEDGKVKTSE